MDTSPSYNAIIWGLCLIGVYVISGKIRKGWLVNVPSFAVDSTTTTYELGFHGPTLIWQGRMDFSQQKQGIGSHKWWMDMGCQGTVQLPWQPQHKTWTIQYRNLTVEDCGESMKITMFIVVYPCLSILDLENIWKSPVFVAFHGTKTSTQPETSQAKQRPNVRISLEQICGMRSSAGFRMWLRSRSVVPDGHVEVSQ